MLSTTSRACASRATSATAAMSAMPSSGLVGVSHQIARVSGRSAARSAPTSARSTGVYAMPHGPSDLVDKPERAAVGVMRDHDVVARRQQHAQQHVGGAHPGPERDGLPAALQCGEALLQRGAGGVGAARVLVARPGAADAVLRVRGRRVDRRDHRAGGGVGLLARVDRLGREAVHGSTLRGAEEARAHPTASPRPRACRRPAPARRRPRRTRSSPCRGPRSPRSSAAAATCAW